MTIRSSKAVNGIVVQSLRETMMSTKVITSLVVGPPNFGLFRSRSYVLAEVNQAAINRARSYVAVSVDRVDVSTVRCYAVLRPAPELGRQPILILN